MTKVEKLREEIDDTLEDTANSLSPSRHKDFIGLDDVLDSLIAAAREDEREKIRNKAECLQRNFDARESKYFYGERQDNGDIDVMATEDCYILPASVLAPEKVKP